MMEFLKKVWAVWKRFGQLIGDFVARIVLTVFYFTIFMPFGIGVRLLGDPLNIDASLPTNWLKRGKSDSTLEGARRLV